MRSTPLEGRASGRSSSLGAQRQTLVDLPPLVGGGPSAADEPDSTDPLQLVDHRLLAFGRRVVDQLGDAHVQIHALGGADELQERN